MGIVRCLAVVAIIVVLPGSAFTTTITVNTTTDELNSDGDCSLREALRAANSNLATDACPAGQPGGVVTDVIQLAATTYPLTIAGVLENATNSGDLDVLDDVELAGAGASMTVLDANLLDRVIDLPLPFTGTATLHDLTLRNGRVIGEEGGALRNLSADVVLRDCVVSSSQADRGGGLRSLVGNVTIERCRFESNSAAEGGGIHNSDRLTLSDSTVIGNSTTIGGGGGIYNTGPAPGLALIRSTVRDNTATGAGGGLYNAAGQASLLNSTVSGNSSSADGGGIASGGGGGGVSLYLSASTVTDNDANSCGGVINKPAMMGLTAIYPRGAIVAGNQDVTGTPDVNGIFTSYGDNVVGLGIGATGFGAAGDQVGTPGDNIDPLLGALALNGGLTESHALQSGSPAIDGGSCLDALGATVADDQRSVARPQNADCDAGSFEFPEPTPTSTHTATPTATPTVTPTPTFIAGCLHVPQSGCIGAASNVLVFQDHVLDIHDKVTWRYLSPATPVGIADFGDPINGTTGYRFCVYDTVGGVSRPRFGVEIAPGGICDGVDCWRQLNTASLEYRHRLTNDFGAFKLQLRGGSGGRLAFSGRGTKLALPEAVGVESYFSQDPSVTVQLIRTDINTCWETVFPDARKNYRRRYKAILR